MDFFMGSRHGQRDTRYLEKHQGLWRVVVAAPRPSTARYKRSLGTASLREAKRLRWPIVAELKATTAPPDEAAGWRSALAAASDEHDDPLKLAFSDHLDHVEEKRGYAEAKRLAVDFR
jgi:hypothetical protein